MGKLILLRHGQSTWNHENRFTGWEDVPLTTRGEKEALEAGHLIRDIPIDLSFTSVLKRAIETNRLALEGAGQDDVPVYKDPALNERDYGDLRGLNKVETARRYGDEQVKIWRRSYDVAPPNGESLRDTAARTLPYFESKILSEVKAGKNVLVSAHGNSLRAIIMRLDRMTPQDVVYLDVPHCVPIVYDVSPEGRVRSKTDIQMPE